MIDRHLANDDTAATKLITEAEHLKKLKQLGVTSPYTSVVCAIRVSGACKLWKTLGKDSEAVAAFKTLRHSDPPAVFSRPGGTSVGLQAANGTFTSHATPHQVAKTLFVSSPPVLDGTPHAAPPVATAAATASVQHAAFSSIFPAELPPMVLLPCQQKEDYGKYSLPYDNCCMICVTKCPSHTVYHMPVECHVMVHVCSEIAGDYLSDFHTLEVH
jgi:hypothetical protein